ncbi:hypothetical protein K458DRAFT_377483 [Lentithecium fluviatile CBS 122367]|uniref:CFEM domain-containing protein n=1 Tax=Lentithecium fluviatile CBS 122367 TaxID=1168545 RepID=A0A6G1IIX2_9PLEO|nr:hypothetical protein K458DRAFT_377483 [Lentithecium fluviatile CBS 122367]
MKLLNTFSVLAVALTSYVHAAQNSTAILQAAQKELPKCALTCMLSGISKSACELTDFYCISHDRELNEQMAACVQGACSIREALTAKNFTETVYGTPIRDHSRMVSYTGIIGGGFAVLAVFLRIIARIPCCGGTWGWDDWAIVVTMLPVLPLTVLSVPLANYGLGKDIWTVPFNNITAILHIYYFDESFYVASIALTKISILLFYLRIFPNQNFRRLVYATLALCVLYVVGFIPAVIVQCIPIRVAWQHWDGEHNGKCINLNIEGWISAACNIILDIIIICLPLHELSKLAMGRRKKAGIMLMFLGGGFVTVISILRLKWMIQFANSQNVTWDYTPVGYWSTLEVHVGTVFACLPALRSLQYRIFPKSRHPNNYYGDPSGAYGYNSKGGSPFPSIARHGKHAELLSAGSRASILRPRNRTTNDKDFVQLDEYEFQLGEGISPSKRDDFFRGLNHTQVQRGSIHADDDALLLPIQGTQGLPTSPFPKNAASSDKGTSGSGNGSGGWNQGIKVKKDYSVTVEISPDPVSPTTSEERMDVDEHGRVGKRGSGQSSNIGVGVEVRNFSRQKLRE